jgi:hypothetical protein
MPPPPEYDKYYPGCVLQRNRAVEGMSPMVWVESVTQRSLPQSWRYIATIRDVITDLPWRVSSSMAVDLIWESMLQEYTPVQHVPNPEFATPPPTATSLVEVVDVIRVVQQVFLPWMVIPSVSERDLSSWSLSLEVADSDGRGGEYVRYIPDILRVVAPTQRGQITLGWSSLHSDYFIPLAAVLGTERNSLLVTPFETGFDGRIERVSLQWLEGRMTLVIPAIINVNGDARMRPMLPDREEEDLTVSELDVENAATAEPPLDPSDPGPSIWSRLKSTVSA